MKTFLKNGLLGSALVAVGVWMAALTAAANDTPDAQTYPFAEKDNISILIFGNSWTHPAAGSFADLALTIGKHVRLVGLRTSGASYEKHAADLNTPGAYKDVGRWNTTSTPWQIADADIMSKKPVEIIASEAWDIVILNDFSQDALAPWTDASKAAFDTLVNTIHTASPTTKIYVNQTWACGAYWTGFAVNGLPCVDNRDAMYEQSVANANEMFHRYDNDPNLNGVIEKLCPCGYAFQLYLYRRPILTWRDQHELQLENDQGRHPNNGGYQLEALTWLRTIFGKLPTYAELPDSYKANFNKFGTNTNLALSCAEDATKAAHSRYLDYGKGTVNFSYTVRFLNYDREVISEQSVSNLLCAVMPDMTKVEIGDGYELDGWRTEIPDCDGVDNPFLNKTHVYSTDEVTAYKIFDTTDFILKRRLVGAAGVERVWTGNTDTDWNKADNWEPQAVPDAESEVTIPYAAAADGETLVTASGPITASSIIVGSGEGLGKATLQFNHKRTNEVASVQVNARGKITSGANGSNGSAPYRVVMHTTGNFTIAEGGAVDVSAKGYGIGYGVDYSNMRNYAGSHGGIAAGYIASPKEVLDPKYSCYGSIRAPVTMGSGGDGNNAKRAGGGVVHLIVDGILTINGDVLAVGGADDDTANRSSSAGGSIWLEAGVFLGSGSVDVRGGRSIHYTAGGSGRIAIITKMPNSEVFSPVSSAGAGGVGSLRLIAAPRTCENADDLRRTGCGTIYIENSTHPAGGGDLYIDGGGVESSAEIYGAHIGSLVAESNDPAVIFNSIVVQNKGRLWVEEGSSLRTRQLKVVADEKTTCSGSERITIIDDPINPTEPTEPTDPTEPTEPTDPTEPPVDPVDPPVDPTDPIDPIIPKANTNWIANVGFDGTDQKWGTLPYGASFLDNRLVLDIGVDTIPYPGLIPVDVVKTNLTVHTTMAFTTYETLPAIDPNIKAGVAALETTTSTNYWVLAKNSDGTANEWTDTGLEADTVNDVLVRVVVTTKKGVTSAKYQFGDSEPVTRTIYAPSSARGAMFTGHGSVSTLEGWYNTPRKLGGLLFLFH